MQRYVWVMMCVGLVACSQDRADGESSAWGVEDGAALPEVMLPPDGDFDGDGLTNAEEEALGLDPKDPSSLGDGVLDSERLVASCEDIQAPEIDLTQLVGASWQALFPPELVEDWNRGRDNLYNVYALSSSDHGVASAVIDPITGPEPRSIVEIAEASGYMRVVSSRAYPTHETWEIALYLPEDHTLGEARAVLLEEMLGQPYPADTIEDVFEPTRRFKARITYTQFESEPVTLLVVYGDGEGEDLYRIVRDATSHLNLVSLGQVYSSDYRCHPFNVKAALTGVDLYLVLDQSGSMDSYNNVLISTATEFSRKLAHSGIDYRFGVTNMSPGLEGALRSGVGWHTDPDVLAREIDDYVIDCVNNDPLCSGFEEYGLFVAERGIQAMKDPSAPMSQRVRPSAKLVTFFMSDEEANSIEDGRRPLPGEPGVSSDQLLAEYESFFSAHTTAYAIYQDGPVCNSFSTGGEAYASVALATGGKVASLCSPDLTSFLDDMVKDLTPAIQTYTLPAVPVPSSLVVLGVDASGEIVRVPRSLTDGYDYDPTSNTLAFFGDYRQQSSSGHRCDDAEGDDACPLQERCVSGECVRDEFFEVVVQAMFHP